MISGGEVSENRCGYLLQNWSLHSQVNSGPLLEFHHTLTIGMRLCFNRLISRSMISTSSSVKCSWLDSSCIFDGASLSSDRVTDAILGNTDNILITNDHGMKILSKTRIIASASIISPLVNSMVCLVSKVVGAISLIRLKAMDTKLPSARTTASLGERPGEAFYCSGFIERSSSRITSDQSSNPTSSTNLKGHNRRRSKQRIENSNLEEQSHPIVTMTDNRTMAEMLRAPTEGYAEAIVVPLIVVEQFELKHSLINMMTTDQFFGLEKDDPHDHIRWGSPPVAKKRTPVFDSHLGYLAAGGKTFPEFRDNIQGYVSAAAVNYNQGNPGYHPPGSGSLPSNTVANPKGELKDITTRNGLVIDGHTVPTPSRSINPEVDKHVEDTFTDPNLVEYTIKVPPPPA
nr:reverse transcriptase domain-containing protein [Tanacetum cinerariifolium]